MPNIDDINKLGALIYTLGNKPLARNIAKEDVDTYHSIFTDDILDTILPKTNTENAVPSLDDLDNINDLDELGLSKDLDLDSLDSESNNENTDIEDFLSNIEGMDSLDEIDTTAVDNLDNNINDTDNTNIEEDTFGGKVEEPTFDVENISEELADIIDEGKQKTKDSDEKPDALENYFDDETKNQSEDLDKYFEMPEDNTNIEEQNAVDYSGENNIETEEKEYDDIFDNITNPFEDDNIIADSEYTAENETPREDEYASAEDSKDEIDLSAFDSEINKDDISIDTLEDDEIELPSIDEIDNISISDNLQSVKEEEKSTTEETTSKYKNLDEELTESDIEEIVSNIAMLPNIMQRYVVDVILEDKLNENDMSKLLIALGTGEGQKAISEILKDALGIVIHEGKETKEKPKSIKELLFGDYIPTITKIISAAAILLLLLFALFQFVYKPIRSNAYFSKGYKVLNRGDYDGAERNFAKGDKLRPNQIKWYNKYAKAYIERLAFDYAIEKLNKAIAFKPRDFKTRMTLGYYYRKRAENDYSKDLYIEGENMYNEMLIYTSKPKELIELYDGLGLLQISRADTLDEKDYYNVAFDTYKTMILKTGDGILPRKRGMLIKIKQDDYEQVKFQRSRINAMKKGYFDDDVYPELTKYLLDKGEFFDARTLLEKILLKYPTSIAALITFADYYIRINHYDTAIKILSVNVMNEYDKNPFIKGREYVHNMLGQAYYTMKEYGNALKEFQNALAINSVYADANYNIGNIYFYQEKNYEVALNHYLIAYANMREEYRPILLNYNLGWITYYKKEYDSSFSYFYNIFDKSRGNAVLSYAIGNTLVHLDKENIALGFYTEALNILLERKKMLGTMYMVANKEFYVLNYLSSLYNNIGVANIRKFTKTGDNAFEKDGFLDFVKSAEYYDQVRVARRELLLEEMRMINIDNQDFGMSTYNLMMLQTKRPLYNTIKLDDYIPKDMYYVD